MKKICILFLTLFIIILTAIGVASPQTPQSDYLRVHIRANSNAACDQTVKYLVRDKMVEAITPWVADCQSKAQAVAVIETHLNDLNEIGERVLRQNGFDYGVKSGIKREEFPTRVYENYTLPAGAYDALIIELGAGRGDNWWCCIYPPLCFASVSGANIIYRSKIAEIIERFYEN